MMSGSHTAKRRLPDGPNPEQTPVEKRPTIRRELPADMPPEFAQSYRQKQELLAKMFADARQLLQMESNHCKNSTCKYGNICTGYNPEPEQIEAAPAPASNCSFSLSCQRVRWWVSLQRMKHDQLKKELREYAAQYLSPNHPHRKNLLPQPKAMDSQEYAPMHQQPVRSQMLPGRVSSAHHVDPAGVPHIRRDDAMYVKLPMGAMARHSPRDARGQAMGAPMGVNQKQSSLGYSPSFGLP